MSPQRPLAALLALSLFACAGTTTQPTTPAEGAAPLETRPRVDVPSFVPSDVTAILRFDGRTTRQTAIASGISEMIAVSGTWSRLSAGSDAHPVDDVDIMLCAARATFYGPGFGSAEWYFVLRHPYDDAEVERRIARMAERQQQVTDWQTQSGFRFARLPIDFGGFAPHFVMITAHGEIVVAPTGDLARILSIAEAQRQARRADEAVDPLLVTEPEEIVFVRFAPRDGQPVPLGDLSPLAVSLRAKRQDARIRVVVDMTYASAGEAAAARDRVDVLQRRVSDNPLARLFGLSRALDAATVVTTESDLHADALLDATTANGVARLLAHVQRQ